MSYHVRVVRREVRAKFEAAGGGAFFENEANLIPFTKANLRHIEGRLELVGFVKKRAKGAPLRFQHDEWQTEATLTASALYLSCPAGSIFEASMFASELVDDELAKFDPQDGTWE